LRIVNTAESAPAHTLDEAFSELTAFARSFLEAISAPEVMSLYRMLLGEMERFPALGRHFYETGPARSISVVESILSGLLDPLEARFRAQAFIRMVEGDAYQRLLLATPLAGKRSKVFSTQVNGAARLILLGVKAPKKRK
jgi:hypothetical protein